ncbi:N-acylglucosamine 2-epimerase [Heyndrickxia camelliae]|uniref:Cellobiose 2-epimerase n=2 Tax=Heyndrickxia camelliae TaxID=1707093 RepID=A0A2N3LGJ3_9BACI|nr:N-acylglucosamine 2-epimerase [Heyndrickxia camelliae]
MGSKYCRTTKSGGMIMKKIDFIQELNERILPFWTNLLDRENGGFYGKVDFQLNVDPNSPKGGVIGARHLWSFSGAYLLTQAEQYLEAATHAYQFLKEKLWDHEHGGIYWLVDYKGRQIISEKHVYAQSFAIYGLSEYAKASGNNEALELAITLFHMLEERCYSPENKGYNEEFTIDWKLKDNELLNEGLGTVYTTNSHLHLLEAYTNLYSVWPEKHLLKRIDHLLDLFSEKIFDRQQHFCHVAFDEKWNRTKNTFSYGHDIETSWLLTETLDVTKLDRPDVLEINKQMAIKVAEEGIAEDGSIFDAKIDGMVNKTRVWWGQAEAVIGFYNAYQLTQDEKFIQFSANAWNYIKTYIHDPRPGGEWFSRIDEGGNPISSLRSKKYTTPENISDSWKGLYHNSRMCYEMIRRLPE